MADSTMGSDLLSRKKAFDEDEELISAAKDDAEAFGRLYDKYYEDIFRYVYGCTFDHALTEDLVSNSVISWWQSYLPFSMPQQPLLLLEQALLSGSMGAEESCLGT